jgi:hypothetical protein
MTYLKEKKIKGLSTNTKLKDLHMHLAYIIEHTREKKNSTCMSHRFSNRNLSSLTQWKFLYQYHDN